MRPMLVLAAALAACATTAGTTPEVRWARAYAVADCAPWDGAAASIFLTDAPEGAPAGHPSLRLTVYHDLQSVAGARWEVGPSEPDAAQAVLCEQEGEACILATEGWVDFERRRGNEPLRGQYEVKLPDGRRLAGSFSAPVRESRALCG